MTNLLKWKAKPPKIHQKWDLGTPGTLKVEPEFQLLNSGSIFSVTPGKSYTFMSILSGKSEILTDLGSQLDSAGDHKSSFFR